MIVDEGVHDATLLDYNFSMSADRIQRLRHMVRQFDEPDEAPMSEDIASPPFLGDARDDSTCPL